MRAIVLGVVAILLGFAGSSQAHAALASDVPIRQRALTDAFDDQPPPTVHVVYLVPLDGVDRQLDVNGTIDTAVARLREWLWLRTGRQLRIDRDPGAATADVTFLRSMHTAAELSAPSHSDALARINWDLWVAGLAQPLKIYAVYVDGDGPSCGLAYRPGHLAAVFLTTCQADRHPQSWDLVMLHELLHALGAVGDDAPHVFAGHVFDDPLDLMSPHFPALNPTLDVDRMDYYGHGRLTRFDIATSPYFDDVPVPADTCLSADPFVTLGGGTCCNGGWLPPGLSCTGLVLPEPPAPPAPSTSGCTIADPFTALGGGACCNGGWLPPGMVCAGSFQEPDPPSGPTGCTIPDPFVSIPSLKGECINGGWVPRLVG